MTNATAKTSSRQLQAYLFCAECEDRFNKNGERYVLKWIAPRQVAKGVFPLLDRINLAIEFRKTSAFSIYSGIQIGIDTDQFAYFALSILWRAAVHRWRLPDRRFAEQLDLGAYDEPIRQYLMSEAPLPNDLVVVLTVCTDSESRAMLYNPAKRADLPFQGYGFLALGVHFDIFLGPNLPDGFPECCCSGSRQHAIFVQNCRERTFQAFAALARTSIPNERLVRR
jgi:hypothetical protein